MDKSMKKHLEDFVTLCYARLEQGEKTRKGAYKKTDLYEQIIEELSDIANYAFLEYMRMKSLKIAKSRFSKKKQIKRRKKRNQKKH